MPEILTETTPMRTKGNSRLIPHFRAGTAHWADLHFLHVFNFTTQRNRGGSGAEFIDRLLATSRSRRLRRRNPGATSRYPDIPQFRHSFSPALGRVPTSLFRWGCFRETPPLQRRGGRFCLVGSGFLKNYRFFSNFYREFFLSAGFVRDNVLWRRAKQPV